MAIIDTVRRELRIVNSTAANIWRLLDAADLSRDEICDLLVLHYGVARSAIDRDLAHCLAIWQALDWVRGTEFPLLQKLATDVPPFGMINMPGCEDVAPCHATISQGFQIGDGPRVSLHVTQDGRPAFHDLVDRLLQMLSGLTLPSPPLMSTAVPEPGLALLDGGDRYWLRAGGRWLWTRDPVEVMSRVPMQILAAGHGGLSGAVMLHAAIVGRPGGCVVMPGVSGAGKSTLTGWLVSQGWAYGGDDIVAVAPDAAQETMLALPFPTALSVKTGSWPLLAPLFPGLLDRPAVPCAGREARYFPLPRDRQMGADIAMRTIRAMVFPCYQAGAETRLLPIDLQETMQILADTGMTTGDHLDAATLTLFFTLLDRLPKYRLTYGHLPDAQRRLEAMLSTETGA